MCVCGGGEAGINGGKWLLIGYCEDSRAECDESMFQNDPRLSQWQAE